MTQFAKLYETERGQIVAIRQPNDDGNPEIRFFFRTNSPALSVCSMAIAFRTVTAACEEDEDAAIQKADAAFAALDEEKVKLKVFEQMDMLEEAFGEEETES